MQTFICNILKQQRFCVTRSHYSITWIALPDNGVVTLLGEVRDEQAKEQITAKVTAIAGTHSVEDELLITQR